jgi:outer membrane protein
MKRLCVALALTLAWCVATFPSLSHAEAPSLASQVAVVNLEGVLRASKASKSIHSQMEKLRDSYQGEISKQEKELREKDKALADQRASLSPEAFEQQRREFQTKVTEVQRSVQTKRAQLDRAYAKALAQIQKTLSQIIADLAKERKLQMVLPASQLLYADEGFNLSKEVLTRLDSKLPDVKVSVEAIK